ncbi:MAG: hypothetical protein OHK0023_02070 [Anaerolineae bacterium]
MTERWDHLYVQRADAVHVATQIRSMAEAASYRAYDPFPGGSITPPSWKQFIKLLAAPPNEQGFVRVFGEHDTTLLPQILAALSADGLVIHAFLTADSYGLEAYWRGQTDKAHLANYLIAEDHAAPSSDSSPPLVPNLPTDVAKLAQARGVNPNQASQMINRMTRGIFGRESDQARQAGALFRTLWDSANGRALAALADRLTLEGQCRWPDFETVREAYGAARMLARRPNATLMDSEQAALRKIPNISEYLPIYYGK